MYPQPEERDSSCSWRMWSRVALAKFASVPATYRVVDPATYRVADPATYRVVDPATTSITQAHELTTERTKRAHLKNRGIA